MENEMRDNTNSLGDAIRTIEGATAIGLGAFAFAYNVYSQIFLGDNSACLLYTSDAADE